MVVLAVSVVVLSALTALLISLSQPRLYGAQTDIIFDPGSDLSDTAATRWLLTQEVVLRSGAVLGPVSAATGIPVRSLNKILAVEIVGQSNVIRFTVANRDPGLAQQLVQMITDEYRKQITALNAAMNPAPAGALAANTAEVAQTMRWSVLTPPHLLDKYVRPQPVQALALGTLAGIFIAAGLVGVLAWPRIARNERSGLDGR